ncbi:FAD-dependent monooxygenase [Nostoc ellipsosporum NOK]|nr:FAD-dependent monooxygenase [Nostoc ellipsosporum NOK]
MIQNKKIAIIGGGPGGLVLARLLQLSNIDVKVYERDHHKNARSQGATLDLHEESGLEALRRAGLLGEFYKHHRPDAGKLRVVDAAMHIHYDDNAGTNNAAEDRPEIDRADLRMILLDSLKPDTVVWESQFVSMIPQDEGWLIKFKNGKQEYADIVIAADGANSKIRSYITEIKPVYSGVTIIEGNIYNASENAPKLWDLVKGGKIFALGKSQSLILSAKGDGSLSFYTGCNVKENWCEHSGIDFTDKQQVFDWFKKEFGEWNAGWQELFASDNMWFVARPQYHYPLDQQWESLSNLTMLGDAAHRMPPYAGEGVNMAMQDAYELAEALIAGEGIAVYEKAMRSRAADVTAMTLESTQRLHSEGAVEWLLEMFEEK